MKILDDLLATLDTEASVKDIRQGLFHTAELPLRRLLRLGLFQVTVGMTLALLAGTLNRVMIVELGVPASLVGVMIALPVVFAPFRAVFILALPTGGECSRILWYVLMAEERNLWSATAV